MRRPNLTEVIVLGFGVYMAFTLLLDSNWMYESIAKNPESMYGTYLSFIGSQVKLAIFSIFLVICTASILFVDNYLIRIGVNILGLMYFTILAGSFVFTYPNIGLGTSMILVVMMVVNINRLIDEQQEERKRKIICDAYNEGGEE